MNAILNDPRLERGMRRQFALLDEKERNGAKRVGWKVGFGAPAVMEKMRISAPLIGFLMDSAVLNSDATVSVKSWTKAAAEPEIAIEIGRDIAPGSSDAQIIDAIAAIGPAIELADIDGPMDDVESILAGNIFQRHVIFGRRDPSYSGARLDGVKGQLFRSGKAVAIPDNLEANTGPVKPVVRQVSETLAAFGRQLQAGDIIIAGSVTPPQFLEPSDYRFSWELNPIGSAAINFG